MWQASPSSSWHLRHFIFPNAVICVASEHKADLPQGAALLLGGGDGSRGVLGNSAQQGRGSVRGAGAMLVSVGLALDPRLR